MILFQALIVVLLFLLLANALVNLGALGRLHPAPPAEEGPRVSILIPVRNEEDTIVESLQSLMEQDYPNCELIILDDHSSDQTPELAEHLFHEAGEKAAHARVYRGHDLPEGWTGKNWACHQLAEVATGEYLFFTDAHTIHQPGTISALVDCATKKGAGLLSGWPRLVAGNKLAEMVSAMVPFLVLSLFPAWLQRLTQARRKPQDVGATRAVTVANADYLFFTRQCYLQIGGHAAAPSQLLEGVALARSVTSRATEGLQFFHCDAGKFSTVHWDGSASKMREHAARIIEAVFHRNQAAFWLSCAALLMIYVLPFVSLCLSSAQTVHTALQQISLIYITHVAVVLRMGTNLRGAALHPVSMVLTLWMALSGRLSAKSAGVQWKGRAYGVSSETPCLEQADS